MEIKIKENNISAYISVDDSDGFLSVSVVNKDGVQMDFEISDNDLELILAMKRITKESKT